MRTPAEIRSIAASLTETVAAPELPSEPLVSVLMLTYNHASFVLQAVESALVQQTEFDYEIVIGDDASTDATIGILHDLQKKHPHRIKLLLARENLGKPTGTLFQANFLRTHHACRGRYIALLEGDDYWTDPSKLALQVAEMERNPRCGLSWHCGRIAYDSGVPSASAYHEKVMPSKPFPKISPGRVFYFHNPALTASVMWRAGLFPEWPDFLGSVPAADWIGHLMHALHGEVAYLDREMCVYRCHGNASWSTRPAAEQNLGFAQNMFLGNALLPEEERASGKAAIGRIVAEVVGAAAWTGFGKSPAGLAAIIARFLEDPEIERAFSDGLALSSKRAKLERIEEKLGPISEIKSHLKGLEADLKASRKENARLGQELATARRRFRRTLPGKILQLRDWLKK